MRPFIAVLLVLLCALLCGPLRAAQVRAKVLAPDGQPVATATIWAGEMGHLDYSEKDGTLRQLTTGADGTFTFDIADNAPAAFVRVQATGFALADNAVKAGDNVLHLQLIKSLWGTVKDVQGAPVADVVVRLLFSPGDEKSFGEGLQSPVNLLSLLKWSSTLPPVQTSSGNDGKWTIQNVNRGVVALQDPRFAASSAFAGMEGATNDKLIALVAKPGADIKGKLLTPDGKPLPGVFILSGDFFGSQLPRTDADGAFTLLNVGTSMMAGPNPQMALMGISLDDEWIISPLIIQKPLTPGQMNEAPEWKATRGIEITGQLIDAKTKAPISNAIISSGMAKPQPSDTEGHFHFRASPQQMFMSVAHPDYVNFWKQPQVPPDATKFDMGRVALTRAVTLLGHVVDERGQPAKSVTLIASYANGDMGQMGETAVTGDDGAFKIKAPAGPITLSFNEDWEAVSDAALKIELNEKTAPIELKARKLPQQQVKGRIVTLGGKGVVGANVTVSVSRPANKTKMPGVATISSTEKTAASDAEGNFTITFSGMINLPKVTKVEADGYFFRKGSAGVDGKAIKTNDWPLPDTVVVEMIAEISGRVLQLDGTPAAGALVFSLEATKFAPVKTDEAGRFTAKNLPEGEIPLLAAHNRNFARVTAKTGTDAEIRVMPPGVLLPSMQRQLFVQMAKDPWLTLNDYWYSVGADKLLALALQKDGALAPGELNLGKADWSKADTALFDFLRESISRDPAWLLQNGAELLKKAPHPKDGTQRFNAEAAFAAVAVLKGDEAARTLATQWLTFAAAQKDTPNQNVENATRLFQLAGIAKALGQKNADGLLLAALTFAQQSGKKSITENAHTWGTSLGIGGVEAFGPLDDEWPIEARVGALTGAVHSVALLDLPRAKLLLDKLVNLRDDPAFKKQPETANPNTMPMPQEINNTERAWHRAQIVVNLEDGAKWVEAQPRFDWNYRVLAARVAWRQKKFDLAARLIRPALTEGNSSNGDMAYLAALARSFDPDLSDKLFAKAEEFATNGNGWEYRSPAAYGLYRAQDNPALARLWLENAWLKSKNLPKDNSWVISATQNALGTAMTALDPVRALEMVAEIPTDGSQTRAGLIAYLLADEALRPTLRAEND